MNKDLFWQIIDNVNQSFPDADQDTRLDKVKETLLQYSLEDIMDWHLICWEYTSLAYRTDLWAACASIGAHATDDGFIDFRSWLISRGKEVYMRVLENPAALTEVPHKGEDLNFEAFGYVASYAYQAKRRQGGLDGPEELYEALEVYKLDPQVLEDIHAEVPQRPDLCPDRKSMKDNDSNTDGQ